MPAKELKSFLGKASYFRRFLPGLAAGPYYGISKEKKGGIQMGRGPSTSLCENKGDLSERPSDDGSKSRYSNSSFLSEVSE
jgi:hypothetical protein